MFTRDFIDDFLKEYNEAEKAKISKDKAILDMLSFDQARPHDPAVAPVYLATAGAPGSAKSTTLEVYIEQNNLQHYVYADPDQVSLKNMNFTYRNSLNNYHFANASSNHEALKNAYNKWRWASNYISHEMMQKAFGGDNGLGEKYNVAHGTTSTSPHITSLYQKIKDRGYRIALLLCYSQDETRKRLIEVREKEQGFVQTAPADVINKGVDFPKRFDVYFQYADDIRFYWNENLKHKQLPAACAIYQKNADGAKLTVINEDQWRSFCHMYLAEIKKHNIAICKAFAEFLPNELKATTTSSPLGLVSAGLFSATASSSSSSEPAASELQPTLKK